MNKTNELLKNLKGQQYEPKNPIASGMFLPNTSGKTAYGKTFGTSESYMQINELDLTAFGLYKYPCFDFRGGFSGTVGVMKYYLGIYGKTGTNPTLMFIKTLAAPTYYTAQISYTGNNFAISKPVTITHGSSFTSLNELDLTGLGMGKYPYIEFTDSAAGTLGAIKDSLIIWGANASPAIYLYETAGYTNAAINWDGSDINISQSISCAGNVIMTAGHFDCAYYACGGLAGLSQNVVILDGDGVSTHTLNFAGGILTGYSKV